MKLACWLFDFGCQKNIGVVAIAVFWALAAIQLLFYRKCNPASKHRTHNRFFFYVQIPVNCHFIFNTLSVYFKPRLCIHNQTGSSQPVKCSLNNFVLSFKNSSTRTNGLLKIFITASMFFLQFRRVVKSWDDISISPFSPMTETLNGFFFDFDFLISTLADMVYFFAITTQT